jgi:hypothetical protein
MAGGRSLFADADIVRAQISQQIDRCGFYPSAQAKLVSGFDRHAHEEI